MGQSGYDIRQSPTMKKSDWMKSVNSNRTEQSADETYEDGRTHTYTDSDVIIWPRHTDIIEPHQIGQVGS